ncbi:MAG: PTS IIA-like nitrogen regulatory protein PtsN [Pseudomonadota bacterium]|jgi:PTS system nitrogen regulatory IIA component|nr:PTS IIA-like nitrogen regulatory protein PtsN [Gammaproteobacteria bacterium]MBU1731711.1 PTS IIA-like nitrogen regulatory protein PtsN [Gammaproteobacteria bacterium]MBU1892535.1 PTS IIA-like nitrogen regulatory protein PtsN [Gammaproteobacteria bacterium]
MELIAKILPLENVIAELDVGSKKRAFEHVGEMLEQHLHLGRSKIFDSLFAREKLGSTGLGHGIAIPHGRIKGLQDTLGVFIHLKEPIPFDAPDGAPVSLLFVLLVPEQATDMHLQILGELAHMFSDHHLREQLNTSRDREVLHRLLTTWAPHAANQR